MAEGAYFLELTVDSEKPVVFTGAMKDASAPLFGRPRQHLNAVIQAASRKLRVGCDGDLNGYVNGARDVRKTQTTNVQTFKSGEKGYLGYVYDGKITRFNDRNSQAEITPSSKLPPVVFLSTYAGDNGISSLRRGWRRPGAWLWMRWVRGMSMPRPMTPSFTPFQRIYRW